MPVCSEHCPCDRTRSQAANTSTPFRATVLSRPSLCCARSSSATLRPRWPRGQSTWRPIRWAACCAAVYGCRLHCCCHLPPPLLLLYLLLPLRIHCCSASLAVQGKHAQGSGGEAAADIYRQAAAADPGPSTSARPLRGGTTLHAHGEWVVVNEGLFGLLFGFCCGLLFGLFPPAVWATRGPVIALRDKRVLSQPASQLPLPPLHLLHNSWLFQTAVPRA